MQAAQPGFVHRWRGIVFFGSAVLLQGCTVLAIADVVGTVAVKSVGLAADAAIGVVKISGKAIGAAADAVTPTNTD